MSRVFFCPGGFGEAGYSVPGVEEMLAIVSRGLLIKSVPGVVMLSRMFLLEFEVFQ
mgnify:CR=1 FL=1